MKTTFLFLIALSFNCFSQTYHPTFRTVNTSWKYYYYIPFGGFEGIDTSRTIGDTTISGKTYKKISGFRPPLLIREDSTIKSIYEYSTFTNSENILYDYRLVKGNQITLKGFDYNCSPANVNFIVDTTFNVNITGGLRKVIKLHSLSGYYIDLTWLESVGAMRFEPNDFSFLHFKYNAVCRGWSDIGGRKLICKLDDNNIVFEDLIRIFKNTYDCDGKHDSCYKLINKSVISTNSNLISIDTLCTYQWFNCSNGYSIIVGQTNKLFTPSISASYAVRISKNGCIDTSKCINFTHCSNVINKNVNNLNNVLQSEDTLSAYQWLNCSSGYSIIAGETNKSFTPSVSGTYAVRISKNGCIDTSKCMNIILCNNVINKNVSILKSVLHSQDTLCTYQWLNCSNGYSIITGETKKSFTPSFSGSYAVSISKNGCIDTSECLNFTYCNNVINKNVSVLNNVLHSQDTLCAYQWLNCSNGYFMILGQTNKSFTPSISGSYAVSISKNGCIDTSKCTNVTICNNVINKNVSVLNNVLYSQDTLCAYQWLNCSNRYSIVLGENMKSFTPSTSGSYAVRISKNGCKDTSKCMNIILCHNLINRNIIIQNNEIHSQEPMGIYQWLNCSDNHSIMAGHTNKFFSPPSTGIYAVKISKNGCIDTSRCISFIKLSIDNELQNRISIYPNPVSNYLEVLASSPVISTTWRSLKITLFNTLGQQFSPNVEVTNQGYRIDIRSLPTGIYLLQIRDKNDNLIKTERIVIQRD